MNHSIFHGLSDILVQPVHHLEQVEHHARDRRISGWCWCMGMMMLMMLFVL